jgi:hypothetical protein
MLVPDGATVVPSWKEAAMRYMTRFTLAAGLVGSVAFAGAATAGTGAAPDVLADTEPAIGIAFAGPGGRAERVGGQLLHGEHSILLEDGTVATMIDDAGTITGVEGSTLSIERADGSALDVEVPDGARIGRNGEAAELGDLQVGDLVHVHRTDGLDEDRTIVFARSEDWEPEHRPFRRGFGHRFAEPAPDAATGEDDAVVYDEEIAAAW